MDMTEETLTYILSFPLNYVTFLGFTYAARWIIHNLLHNVEKVEIANCHVVSQLTIAASTNEELNEVACNEVQIFELDKKPNDTQKRKQFQQVQEIDVHQIVSDEIANLKQHEIVLETQEEEFVNLIMCEVVRQEEEGIMHNLVQKVDEEDSIRIENDAQTQIEWESAKKLNLNQCEKAYVDIFLVEDENEVTDVADHIYTNNDGTKGDLSEKEVELSFEFRPEIDELNSYESVIFQDFAIDAKSKEAKDAKSLTICKEEHWRDEHGLLMEGISDFYDFQASTNPSRPSQTSRQSSPNITRKENNKVTDTEEKSTENMLQTLQCCTRSRSLSPLPTSDNLQRGLETRRTKKIKQNEMDFQKLGIQSNIKDDVVED